MLKIAGIRNRLTLLLLASCSVTLIACGDGPASPAAAQAQTPVADPGTIAPSIALSGNPGRSITVGQSYSFVPTANGGAQATYSIANKPDWAVFDVATGRLTGTPEDLQVGSYANIVITASNSSGSVSLAGFSINVVAAGSNTGSATLSWMPPRQNTDGSSISNLAGYNIYQGTSAASLSKKIQITNAGLTVYTVADLGKGTHYFGISAFTSSGAESGISEVGSKTIM